MRHAIGTILTVVGTVLIVLTIGPLGAIPAILIYTGGVMIALGRKE